MPTPASPDLKIPPKSVSIGRYAVWWPHAIGTHLSDIPWRFHVWRKDLGAAKIGSRRHESGPWFLCSRPFPDIQHTRSNWTLPLEKCQRRRVTVPMFHNFPAKQRPVGKASCNIPPAVILCALMGCNRNLFYNSTSTPPQGIHSMCTFVYRSSKLFHVVPSKSSDAAVKSADPFVNEVFRYHRIPGSILSDRDPRFSAMLWKRVSHLCGIRIALSSSHHPETDDSSAIMNRMVENL